MKLSEKFVFAAKIWGIFVFLGVQVWGINYIVTHEINTPPKNFAQFIAVIIVFTGVMSMIIGIMDTALTADRYDGRWQSFLRWLDELDKTSD